MVGMAGLGEIAAEKPHPEAAMSISDATRNRIESIIKDNRIVLFMKGNRNQPQCGFSAKAVGILQDLGEAFETVDVLRDPEIRSGIK